MAIYRGGEGQVKVGAPNQLEELYQALEDAVAAATAAMTASQTAASNAETSAASSASSATESEISATSSETSADNSEVSYQNLINLYLGVFASDPTTDNDGTALEGGELYYNSTDNKLYVYDIGTAAWENLHGDLKSDGSVSMSGDLDMAGNEITNYAESDSSPAIASGTLTLDLTNGNIFNVGLDASVTTLTISNTPTTGGVNIVLLLTQDATGSRTITWPASVKWAGGITPTLTTTANAVDIISMFSVDSGTTWYAFTGGLDMS